MKTRGDETTAAEWGEELPRNHKASSGLIQRPLLPFVRTAFLFSVGFSLTWTAPMRADSPVAEPSPLAETAGPAMGAGEQFVFQARWKIFSRAGRITVSADDTPAFADAGTGPAKDVVLTADPLKPAVPTRRIRVDISSDGIVAHLYTYRATGETHFDLGTGRMLSARYQAAAGKRRQDRSIRFDADSQLAYYRDALVPGRDEDIVIPEGEPLDLITCLVTARRWNLKPGDTRDIVVLADKRFYPLRLRAERRETIKGPLGTFAALLIVPESVGKARGLFRKGGGMRVWIEDSPRALPLRIEVKGSAGTVNVDLIEYDPPLGLRDAPGAGPLRVKD